MMPGVIAPASGAAPMATTAGPQEGVTRLRRSRAALQFLAAFLIGGLWMSYVFWHAAHSGRGADFSWVYGIGEILRSRGPSAIYDFAALQESIARHFPVEPGPLPFVRPPFYALLLAPLSALPPGAALQLWLVINGLAFAGALFLIARVTTLELSEVAWHAAIFFPAFYSFYNRQDVPLVLLPAVAAYWLVSRGRHFQAGLALAFCSVKFHLLLLVPLALVGKKNWRALRGLLAGTSLLLLISLLMVGPSGLAGYVEMLIRRPPPNTDFPDRLCSLWALAQGSWIRIPLVLGAVGAAWVSSRRLPQTEALAAAWLASLLITPHIYLSDYLLALPAFLLLGRLSRICLFSSLPALFPLTPVLMPYGERFLLVTPVSSLLCLLGAAASSAKR